MPRLRRIVIIIEDLDRIENNDIVEFYLNEFYRLYIEGNEQNRKGITLNCLILPNIFNLILFAVPVFLAVYFGADVVQSIIDFIPKVIINGINAAGGMIGAVGLALLLASLNFKNLWAFFALGFFAASYLGINQIGCAVVAAIVVVLTYMIDEQIEAAKGEN